MGSKEDPEDGGAVAAALFGAVAVYGVSHTCYIWNSREKASKYRRVTEC